MSPGLTTSSHAATTANSSARSNSTSSAFQRFRSWDQRPTITDLSSPVLSDLADLRAKRLQIGLARCFKVRGLLFCPGDFDLRGVLNCLRRCCCYRRVGLAAHLF